MFLGKSAAFEAVHTGMCTEIAHLAFGKKAAQALRAVKKEAQRLEQLFSRFLPESDIGRINRFAGVKHEKISAETCEVLSKAKKKIGKGQTIKNLFDEIIENQSLQVDVVSGATLTSKAHLNAVENALKQAEGK